MNLRAFCLIALLSTAAVARAQEPLPDEEGMTAEEAAQMQAVQDATQAYYTRAAIELAVGDKARDLALAATLLQFATQAPPPDGARASDAPSQPSPQDPRIDEWRRLASTRGGKDVLVDALLMQADTPGNTQRRDQAAERWRRLEPDNLAPLLFTASPATDLVAAARTTSRFDLHMYEQVRWMQSALQAHPPGAAERAILSGGEDVPPNEAAAMTAMGIWAAVGIPSMQAVTAACRGDARSSSPTRREDCRHVAQVMADQSDTSIGTSIGIALLQQIAATPEQRLDADERRRRQDWWMLQWGRVASQQPHDGSEQFARLLLDPTIGREQDLIERVLTDAGVALDPPAGWQPPPRAAVAD